MRVIPAIDLLDVRAVRLREGKKDEVTVYREHPEELVAELAAGGAERIHVVDLDGAFAGARRHVQRRGPLRDRWRWLLRRRKCGSKNMDWRTRRGFLPCGAAAPLRGSCA